MKSVGGVGNGDGWMDAFETATTIVCLHLFGCNGIDLRFWVTMGNGVVSRLLVSRTSLTTTMAANSRILRALQMRRIVDTSRKINPTHSSTPNTPSILTSLPEHKPLLPLLLSYHVPPTLAKACADRYDKYASQLRSETETKLVPYLVDSASGRPGRVYSLFLDNYNQTLRDWAQSTLNIALKSLKRDSAVLQNWDVTYPPPLWLPVGLLL